MRHTSRLPVAVLAAAVLSLAVLRPAAGADAPPPAPAPAVLAPTAVLEATAPVPTEAGLRTELASLLRRAKLGTASAVVMDATSGEVLFGRSESRPAIPASTIKLLTAAAALDALGPKATISTRAVVDDLGARTPVVTLVGGGDATLARSGKRYASLSSLADQVVDALPVDAIALRFDASAFTGPGLESSWPASFPRAGIVAPVSALMVDHGRVNPRGATRTSRPARQAAQVFAELLAERGVRVDSVKAGRAASGADLIGEVRSPSIAVLVQDMLTDSDNDIAESLARLVAIKTGTSADFSGAGEAVADVARQLGLPTQGLRIADGSGLSGRNRVAPLTLGSVLVKAAQGEDPDLSVINGGLAVAGLTGTLADRFTAPQARAALGIVRAKTGTLTGVSSLAGTVRDADGRMLTFAVIGNGVRSSASARGALDVIAARLAECGCR